MIQGQHGPNLVLPGSDSETSCFGSNCSQKTKRLLVCRQHKGVVQEIRPICFSHDDDNDPLQRIHGYLSWQVGYGWILKCTVWKVRFSQQIDVTGSVQRSDCYRKDENGSECILKVKSESGKWKMKSEIEMWKWKVKIENKNEQWKWKLNIECEKWRAVRWAVWQRVQCTKWRASVTYSHWWNAFMNAFWMFSVSYIQNIESSRGWVHFFALLCFPVKGKFHNGDGQGTNRKSRKIVECLSVRGLHHILCILQRNWASR